MNQHPEVMANRYQVVDTLDIDGERPITSH